MSSNSKVTSWWGMTRGDIDATIAQVGLNLAQMIIPVFLLLPVGISAMFSVPHLLPGYALGFLVGGLGLAFLGKEIRNREGRTDVTAHVYGNNVPAILAFTLSIMLPIYLETHDQILAWEVTASAVIWTGIIKLISAPFAKTLRTVIPMPASMTVFGAAMYSYLALVLLQRLFDNPLVGIIALAIVASAVLAQLRITRFNIPPFLIVWLLPLAIGIINGYVKPAWTGFSFTAPWVASLGPVGALGKALPYFSVIVPMAVYQILQDIAAVEGGAAAGDEYDARKVLLCDGLGTLVCGLAGSVVTPVVYALHPPYKAMGARIGFQVWTPVVFMAIVAFGMTMFVSQLFPWSILSAMIAYVSIGVGMATLGRVPRKYHNAVLLGFVIPCGAIVISALNSALSALGVQLSNPNVQTALNKSVYWSSLQGLSSGFLFLVLVVSAVLTELIDRHFTKAAIWCLIASAFSWVGLLHAARIGWGAAPQYALGWLVAAIIVYAARWWADISAI
ncbi:hypothetical protein Anamo_1079 [Acetomicrobium mobile DSM 13181]|uniref:Permease n=1 Tax=Acetomicrobium mobile (strain ATCC BAA-54 / DSM 13181 / JCM 12221 / NGA) TaxID=891968 RepID=I4BWP7_ACEMN|nr:hypothetical protein [Acetomicrobium mobile]AFM21704.1 hypothetical protein Anamo_1079 [Acetomicrobium mobile DSM 13181]